MGVQGEQRLMALVPRERNAMNTVAACALACASLSVLACATGAPAHPVRSSVRVEPVSPPPTASTISNGNVVPAPPPIDANQPALSSAPERRIAVLDVPAGTPI